MNEINNCENGRASRCRDRVMMVLYRLTRPTDARTHTHTYTHTHARTGGATHKPHTNTQHTQRYVNDALFYNRLTADE